MGSPTPKRPTLFCFFQHLFCFRAQGLTRTALAPLDFLEKTTFQLGGEVGKQDEKDRFGGSEFHWFPLAISETRSVPPAPDSVPVSKAGALSEHVEGRSSVAVPAAFSQLASLTGSAVI